MYLDGRIQRNHLIVNKKLIAKNAINGIERPKYLSREKKDKDEKVGKLKKGKDKKVVRKKAKKSVKVVALTKS